MKLGAAAAEGAAGACPSQGGTPRGGTRPKACQSYSEMKARLSREQGGAATL